MQVMQGCINLIAEPVRKSERVRNLPGVLRINIMQERVSLDISTRTLRVGRRDSQEEVEATITGGILACTIETVAAAICVVERVCNIVASAVVTNLKLWRPNVFEIFSSA